MQLLFDKSFEFEKSKGLGLIKGEVVKINKNANKKTHIGWNKFKIQDKKFQNIFKKFENKHFYFVHSYYASPKIKNDILGSTNYEKIDFCSIVKKGKIFGTQFHPEKSGYWGIEFLKNLKRLEVSMSLKNYYGLPKKVIFCKKTLISNQRPNSAVEFNHNKNSKKDTLKFNKNGISESWRYSRLKKKINFKKRKKLLKLLEKHRGKHGEFDCIVPGSGGKDSCYAAHVLKFKYGMNPLTVTWPPILYTDYGLKNFKNWIKTGNFKNISAKRDEKTMRVLTKLSIFNLLHPFQTFMLGQKIFPVKIALKYKIPLVFMEKMKLSMEVCR